MKIPGFNREDISERYNVFNMNEDSWHQYSTEITYKFLEQHVANKYEQHGLYLLNAGCGVYRLRWEGWVEVCLDLFILPLKGHPLSVCSDLKHLPFESASFDLVVCVGEVFSYCNPSSVIKEVHRILKPGGIFVFDYSSSKGCRHWLRQSYGRATDLVEVPYNGKPEKVWVYHPEYITSLLRDNNFFIKEIRGIHSYSCLLTRTGISVPMALKAERFLSNYSIVSLADTVIILSGVEPNDLK